MANRFRCGRCSAKSLRCSTATRLGEAENAFRKAVLMCEGTACVFRDAAGMAFGKADDGKTNSLRPSATRKWKT